MNTREIHREALVQELRRAQILFLGALGRAGLEVNLSAADRCKNADCNRFSLTVGSLLLDGPMEEYTEGVAGVDVAVHVPGIVCTAADFARVDVAWQSRSLSIQEGGAIIPKVHRTRVASAISRGERANEVIASRVVSKTATTTAGRESYGPAGPQYRINMLDDQLADTLTAMGTTLDQALTLMTVRGNLPAVAS